MPRARSILGPFCIVMALCSASLAGRFPDPVPPSPSAPLPIPARITVTVRGLPPRAGDEIVAWSVHPRPGLPGSWERTVAGHRFFEEPAPTAEFPVLVDDPATAEAVEGVVPGEEVVLGYWSAGERKVYTAFQAPSGDPAFLAWPGGGALEAALDFVEGVRVPLRTGEWNLVSFDTLRGYAVSGSALPGRLLASAEHVPVASIEESFPLRSVEGRVDRIAGSDGNGTAFWMADMARYSTLRHLSPGYGYWVHAAPGPSRLAWMTFPGSVATGAEHLPVASGWTLAGYWGGRTYHRAAVDPSGLLRPPGSGDDAVLPSVGDAWWSLGDGLERVTSTDGGGSRILVPSLPKFSTLGYVAPGYGYWVKMASPGVLSFRQLRPPTYEPSGPVTFSWDPVEGAEAYHMYWSAAPLADRTSGTRIPNVPLPFTLEGVPSGAYYFAVTAVVAGAESDLSEQVRAVVR